MNDETPHKKPSTLETVVKLAVSAAAIIVGLFLAFGLAPTTTADAVFVGAITAVLAVYLWAGVTRNQGRVVAVVLIFISVYAFVRGFGVHDLAVVRQLGGIVAIVSGVVLLLPFIRTLVAKPKA